MMYEKKIRRNVFKYSTHAFNKSQVKKPNETKLKNERNEDLASRHLLFNCRIKLTPKVMQSIFSTLIRYIQQCTVYSTDY